MTLHVRVSAEPFEPWAEVAREQQTIPAGMCGACATFVGLVRSDEAAGQVQRMTVEHYPGMTERAIEATARRAEQRWGTRHILVIHRVGNLVPGEPIVLIAVWAEHRAAAFDACRALITFLKSEAPFWKQEHGAEGLRWVDTNTTDPGVP